VEGFLRAGAARPAAGRGGPRQRGGLQGEQGPYHREPEAPDTQIVIACTVPYTHQADTGAYRLSLLPRTLALEMLNRRLTILSKMEKAPFIRANADVEEPSTSTASPRST